MPSYSLPPPRDPVLTFLSGLFEGVLGVAAALALALFVLPSANYLSLATDLEICTAFAGAAVFFYLWFRDRCGTGLLYAAGAFALCGVANIAWYAAVLTGAGTFTFPGLIDMGFVASILLLSSAYPRLFPERQVRGLVLFAILLLMLVIPLAIFVTGGISRQTLMILLYFFASGSIIITELNHVPRDNPKALVGTFLFALAFLIYPLFETFFSGNPYLSLVGALVVAGLSLIVLGLLPPATCTTSPGPAVTDPSGDS